MKFTHQVSKKYARAFYTIAQNEGKTDACIEQLKNFNEILQTYKELSKFLTSSSIPLRDREKVLHDISRALSMEPLVYRILFLLMRNHRLYALPQVIEEVERIEREEKGYMILKIITAFPLNDRNREVVVDTLQNVFRKKVLLEEEINPSILGGLIVQRGSRYFDGSVRGQLHQLKHQLIGEVDHGARN